MSKNNHGRRPNSQNNQNSPSTESLLASMSEILAGQQKVMEALSSSIEALNKRNEELENKLNDVLEGIKNSRSEALVDKNNKEEDGRGSRAKRFLGSVAAAAGTTFAAIKGFSLFSKKDDEEFSSFSELIASQESADSDLEQEDKKDPTGADAKEAEEVEVSDSSLEGDLDKDNEIEEDHSKSRWGKVKAWIGSLAIGALFVTGFAYVVGNNSSSDENTPSAETVATASANYNTVTPEKTLNNLDKSEALTAEQKAEQEKEIAWDDAASYLGIDKESVKDLAGKFGIADPHDIGTPKAFAVMRDQLLSPYNLNEACRADNPQQALNCIKFVSANSPSVLAQYMTAIEQNNGKHDSRIDGFVMPSEVNTKYHNYLQDPDKFSHDFEVFRDMLSNPDSHIVVRDARDVPGLSYYIKDNKIFVSNIVEDSNGETLHIFEVTLADGSKLHIKDGCMQLTVNKTVVRVHNVLHKKTSGRHHSTPPTPPTTTTPPNNPPTPPKPPVLEPKHATDNDKQQKAAENYNDDAKVKMDPAQPKHPVSNNNKSVDTNKKNVEVPENYTPNGLQPEQPPKQDW